MNGVHDMGGMHGMGPVQAEKDEHVFHARWEARTFALNIAMAASGKWNIDTGRHEIELIPAAEYLRMSYYEKWFVRLVELLVKTELVSREELDTGHPAPGVPKANPLVTADQVPAMLAAGSLASRPIEATPRFQPGQRVHVRNMHPAGHTRLPRYARGKLGTIDRHRGAYVFPDTHAHSLGERPQHVYSVRLTAQELWGDMASPRDAVYIDMWDDYLEPA
ncbi:MAG TPA: nitrile hydratase subunit beta [Bryobacteraceae bacterium]|nr:nitrile hydratase subunit beta [Bryobacteraceae bacterium]